MLNNQLGACQHFAGVQAWAADLSELPGSRPSGLRIPIPECARM